MEITINTPNQIREIIESRLGITLEQMASEVIETRIKNLFKQFGPRKPVGRPRFDEGKRRFRSLAKSLAKTFADLKEVDPENYEALYGELERTLNSATAKENLALLEWFSQHEPWRSNPDTLPAPPKE